MSLQIWLPLNGDLHNQGLDQSVKSTLNSGAILSNNGKIGKCYSFDGTDDWIQWSINKSNYGGKPISCTCWFKSDQSKSSGTLLDLAADLCLSYTYSSNTIVFNGWRVYDNNGTRIGDSVTTPNSYNASQWHHIAAIFDATINKLYVDGELAGEWQSKSQTYWTPLLGSSYNKFSIGKSAGSSYWVGGLMNDIRVYNHALSPKEVKEISQGLILNYKLNQPNQNLITEETYLITPWKDAIQAHEIYQGKFAYKISNNVLYSKSGSGANNIFPNVSYLENTQYTMSVDWRDDYRTDGKNSSLYLRFHYTDGTYTQIISPANSKQEWTHSVLISTAGKTVDKCTTTYGNGGQLYITNLKLEIGNIETPFSFNNDIYDSSGYNNNGIPSGSFEIDNSSAKYNISTLFNGTDNAIQIPFNAMLGLTAAGNTAYSFSCWIKVDTTSSKNWATILGGPSGFEMETKNSSGTTGSFYAYSWGKGNIAYSLGEWHHIAMTNDTSQTIWYLDGEQAFIGTSPNIPIGDYFIGSWKNSSSQNYKGAVNDVRIYTTALSADDIKELYKTSKIVNGTTVNARDLEVSA